MDNNRISTISDKIKPLFDDLCIRYDKSDDELFCKTYSGRHINNQDKFMTLTLILTESNVYDKRFTIELQSDDGLVKIYDNEFDTFYFIDDSFENVKLFVKRLNELDKEKNDYQKSSMIWKTFSKKQESTINELKNENIKLKKELTDLRLYLLEYYQKKM